MFADFSMNTRFTQHCPLLSLYCLETANNQKKRKQESGDTDSGGYNSDDEERLSETGEVDKLSSPAEMSEPSSGAETEKGGHKGGRKKKKLGEFKREERNAREKERSFRISRQISELRGLLSTGGVIVPKGTKSSVLTEAAVYIRMLQQHQYRSEMWVCVCFFYRNIRQLDQSSSLFPFHIFCVLFRDRHQLVQQIQMIGGGALGQQAATAVRHVAAQNGVWSLGNFGGVPPKSAMYHKPVTAAPGESSDAKNAGQQQSARDGSILPNKIETNDYRFVFNSCTVGMVSWISLQ
jgi:hypothetical protein